MVRAHRGAGPMSAPTQCRLPLPGSMRESDTLEFGNVAEESEAGTGSSSAATTTNCERRQPPRSLRPHDAR